MNLNYSFPYPVLGFNDDFIDGHLRVTPKIELSDKFLNLTLTSADIEISNEYISSLYLSGDVSLVLKIVCPSTLYSASFKGNNEISIDSSNLANHFSLEVFLVANCDIENYSDSTFNLDYFINGIPSSFKIEKGYIVGYGGKAIIPLDYTYEQSASSMFKFNRISNDLIYVDTSSSDYIEISYPYTEDQPDIAKYLPANNKGVTFLNLFIIPALTQAFAELKKNEELNCLEEFKETNKWAMTLVELYPDFVREEPFVSAQNYLQELLNSSGDYTNSPVLESFKEILRN